MPDRTQRARASIRKTFRIEYDAGARAGFLSLSKYPDGFPSWPLPRRDAFFAVFNAGRLDRIKKNGGQHG